MCVWRRSLDCLSVSDRDWREGMVVVGVVLFELKEEDDGVDLDVDVWAGSQSALSVFPMIF